MNKRIPQTDEIWLTPFEPHGLVRVVHVYPVVGRRGLVRVLYLHDHYGYKAGTVGDYIVDELRQVSPALLALIPSLQKGKQDEMSEV